MILRWFSCLALILTLEHSVESLSCYECAGYWAAEPPNMSHNNDACARDSFVPSNVTVTNYTADPADPLFCFTFIVYNNDANDGRPYTIRGAQTKSNRSGTPFNMAIVDKIRGLAYTLDVERSEIFSTMETCHEDLCNGSQATTIVVMPSVLLALLPLFLFIFLA